MKRVFLDTNILVDYALGREFGDDAEQLLQRGHDGEVSLMVSYLTFANMAYILRTKVDIYALLEQLSNFITVLPMDQEQLQKALGQKVTCFNSGPFGGDQQIGAAISQGQMHLLIFFWDPLNQLPHDPDIKALLRLAAVWNIPVACNRATADFLISSKLFNEEYTKILPDYSSYLNRFKDSK